MANSVVTLLQSPVDTTSGERDTILPITSVDAVVVDDTTGLTDWMAKVEKPGIVVSATRPTHACLWAKTK